MLHYPNENTMVFIDGANLFSSLKGLGYTMDYNKLRMYFTEHSRLLRINYYTGSDDSQEYNNLRPFMDYLSYNGYNVITKPVKRYVNGDGVERLKGNMDIEIAVDMMESAGRVQHLILMSGDGDFCPVVQAVQRRGCRVSAISTIRTSPPCCSDDLRRQVDGFLDLADEEFQNNVSRDRMVFTHRVGN